MATATSSRRILPKRSRKVDATDSSMPDKDECSVRIPSRLRETNEEPKKARGRPPKKKQKLSMSKQETSTSQSPETFTSINDDELKQREKSCSTSDVESVQNDEVGAKRKRGRQRSERTSRSSPLTASKKTLEESPKSSSEKHRYSMRGRRKIITYTSGDDVNISSSDESSDTNAKRKPEADEEGQKKKRRQSKDQTLRPAKKGLTKKVKESSPKSLVAPKDQRTCPHCNAVMSNTYGLSYHIQHQVCLRKLVKKDKEEPPKKSPQVRKPSPGETSKKKLRENSPKSRFGPKEQKRCPHCHVVMSSLSGMAYHIKHQVCRRENEEAKAYLPVKKRGKDEAPFPPIRPGALFFTIFGVVKVIKDDRIPDDYGTTLVGPNQKQQMKLIKEKQQKNQKSKSKRQGILQSKAQMQYHLLHKSMLRQLYQNKNYSCCISSQHLPTNHCFSYEAIRAGYNQEHLVNLAKKPSNCDADDAFQSNPIEPADSYPDRIVECMLLPDVRKRIFGVDEDDADTNLTRADVAKQVVQQAQIEAANQTGEPSSQKLHAESTIKNKEARIFIQRRLLHTLYKPDIPVYVCPFCGRQFNSGAGHKSHVNSKVCQIRRITEQDHQSLKIAKDETTVTLEPECAEVVRISSSGRPIRKSVKKSITAVSDDSDSPQRQSSRRSHGAKAVLSSFIRFDPLISAVYPAVVQSLLGPILSTGEEIRVQRRRRGVNMTLVHIDGLDSKQDAERRSNKEENRTLKKLASGCSDEYSSCSSSTSSFYSSAKKKNKSKPTSLSSATIDAVPSRAKRISNHQGPFTPRVCENFLEVIRVLDSGRFPSMSRYYGAHADDCCVPFCKSLGETLYCCEFCSNVSHFECLQRKVIVREWDPEGDFLCHICLRTVLTRMARQRIRLEKQQLLAAEKRVKFVLPTVNPMKSVNPSKFDPLKTAMYPEVYDALAYLRKGAKVNNKGKTKTQRKRTKRKRSSVDSSGGDVIFDTSEQSTGAVPIIIDTLVLAEEIRNGRYPSMKPFNGTHEELCLVCKKGGDDEEQENSQQQLHYCDFCNKSEHMECLRSRLTIREFDPDTDDFMCHRCILTVVARRARAEKRRLQKREEALEKAGVGLNNPFYQINSGVPTSAIALEREVRFETMSDFDIHENSFDPCPSGGLGGLVCCQQCEDSYSRFLSETAKEIESQTVSRVGREVSEMLELLEDAKLRLQQALEASETNDFRRSMCSGTFYSN